MHFNRLAVIIIICVKILLHKLSTESSSFSSSLQQTQWRSRLRLRLSMWVYWPSRYYRTQAIHVVWWTENHVNNPMDKTSTRDSNSPSQTNQWANIIAVNCIFPLKAFASVKQSVSLFSVRSVRLRSLAPSSVDLYAQTGTLNTNARRKKLYRRKKYSPTVHTALLVAVRPEESRVLIFLIIFADMGFH